MLSFTICAWHRRYYGYPLITRIGRWAGAWTTHAICGRCAQRVVVEYARNALK